MHKESDITIRPATASDAGAIAVILRELGWFDYIKREPPTATEARVAARLELCGANDSHSVMVAENSAGAVVGYIATHWLPYLMLAGSEGYVSELFVLEAERGKGIGGMLLETAKRQAIERGCGRLQLVTGKVRESYNIYKKLGWTERPEIADFILPLE